MASWRISSSVRPPAALARFAAAISWSREAASTAAGCSSVTLPPWSTAGCSSVVLRAMVCSLDGFDCELQHCQLLAPAAVPSAEVALQVSQSQVPHVARAALTDRDDMVQRRTERGGMAEPPIHALAADGARPPVALSDHQSEVSGPLVTSGEIGRASWRERV